MSAITIESGPTAAAPLAGRAPELMPSGLALSAALHLGLIAVIALGLPSLFAPALPQETPIAVELVTIAPDTRATQPNPFRPKREAKPVPAIAPPAPKPQPERQPQPAAATPPSSAPPPPPPPPKPVEAKAPPLRPPTPEPKPEFAERAQPEPPRPEVRKTDARAFAKLLDKLEDRPPDKPHPQVAQFDALLKNLTQQQTAAAADAPPSPHQVAAAAAVASSQPNAPLGSALTASQKDLIIQKIERCWDVPAGARDAKDLDIEIKAVVNPDGTVHEAAIVDAGRYAADQFFRAAADSAKRAVLNPQCSPLPVPPDKYEAWHNLDLFFNPKDLL